MRLLLHIGTEKTGTTASQFWFRDNAEALKRQGVLYPRSLGETDHRRLSVAARDPLLPDDGFPRFGITSPEEHAIFVGKTRDAFVQELEELAPNGIDTVIVSSEHLHSRIHTDAMVASVRDFFGSMFEAIEVVVALRPQVDLAVSYLGTVARNGARVTSSWFDRVTPENSYYNYDELIGRWERAFGESNVRIIAYDRGEPFARYACAAGRWDTAELSEVGRRNVASTIQLMAMTNAVNDGGTRGIATVLRNRLNAVVREVAGEPLSLGRDLAEVIQSRFADSNARLAARRPDLSPEILHGDLGKHDRESNIGMLDQVSPFAVQLRAMLEAYELALAREQARALLAEADLLIAGGDVPAADGKGRAALRVLASGSEVPGADGMLDRLRERADALLARCAARAVSPDAGDRVRRPARAAGASRRRVAVLDVRAPFGKGGAGPLGDGLVEAVDRLVPGTRAELVHLPIPGIPGHAVLEAMMMGQLAAMAESGGTRIDLVVALGFPAWLAQTERKVCWVGDDHRALYDPGQPLARDDALRDRVHRLDAAALGAALGCFSTSPEVARRLADDTGIASEVVRTPSRHSGRIVAGPYGDGIVAVGRGKAADRLELLIEALAQVPEVKLRILAAGGEVRALRERAAALGVGDRCDITASVSDEMLVRQLASARAVFAGPSDEDNGVSAVEALQAAKPVITFTDAGEVRRIVESTESGWVCAPAAAALAAVLGEAWAETPTALHRRVQPGHELAGGVTWENVIARIVEPFL